LQNYYKVFRVATSFLRHWNKGCNLRVLGQASSARINKKSVGRIRKGTAPAVAFSTNRDGCRRPGTIPVRAGEPVFRRLPGYLPSGKAFYPQILSRRFRIAGTYCRQRWFVRYARSESLLCAPLAMPDSQPIRASKPAIALPS
jgi:hypothetical protein